LVDEQAVLAVDVGGSHVKVLASGETESRREPSSPSLTPTEMVEAALHAAQGWRFDLVAVGIPAPVHNGRVVSEPFNLGRGWVGFDFEAAFGAPTRVMNDAAMQALGSYEGGTMLFLGLGTGLGSALVSDGVVEPMELGHLPFRKRTYEDYLGERGRAEFGRKRWERLVADAVAGLTAALEPDYVVLGGGNAPRLRTLPPNARLGANSNAFTGAFRIWQAALPPPVGPSPAAPPPVGPLPAAPPPPVNAD
jgi:polyphosphate glucokinase